MFRSWEDLKSFESRVEMNGLFHPFGAKIPTGDLQLNFRYL